MLGYRVSGRVVNLKGDHDIRTGSAWGVVCDFSHLWDPLLYARAVPTAEK